MSRAAIALALAATGCVAWTRPRMEQRRLPLASPQVALRTDVLPGTGTVLLDGSGVRFAVDTARLCRRTELVKEQVVTFEQKQLTGAGVTAIVGGVAAVLTGIVISATSDEPGAGAALVFPGAGAAGYAAYQRWLSPPTVRERLTSEQDVPGATLDVPCPDASPAQVLGELVLTTPWGANVRAGLGSDGAAVFPIDWAASGIDLRQGSPGQKLMAAWRVRSSRTGLTVDYAPTVADRDAAIAAIERARADAPTEPPELAVIALAADGGALVAGEPNLIRLTIENRGGGVARDLRATLRSSYGAIDGTVLEFGDLGPKETKTRTAKVPLTADETEPKITVVAIFSLAAHTPPANATAVLPVTPRLCPPAKLTRAEYAAKRDKLRGMVKAGVLTEADFQRYDAILLGCLR